jgi:hypothetical protein
MLSPIVQVPVIFLVAAAGSVQFEALNVNAELEAGLLCAVLELEAELEAELVVGLEAVLEVELELELLELQPAAAPKRAVKQTSPTASCGLDMAVFLDIRNRPSLDV